MVARGLFVLAVTFNCVLSLPVTTSHLENEDVKVMKCIVEALADVLSRPHPLPVSQECLVTLRTDNRLVSILRHRNFLKELQDIAVQGANERAQPQVDSTVPDLVTQIPQTTDNVADQSMFEALGGPGERSILAQKRRTEAADKEQAEDESLKDKKSQEQGEQEKRDGDESAHHHISDSTEDWSEGKAGKRKEKGAEEDEETRAHSEQNSDEGFQEENMAKDKKGNESNEKRNMAGNMSEEKKSAEDEDEETREELVEKKRRGDEGAKKRSLFSHHGPQTESEEEDWLEGMKTESEEDTKRSIKRSKSLPTKKSAGDKKPSAQQEVAHHSKEVMGEEENTIKEAHRSPEEKELQMMARRAPEERRGLEEEGSASRKSEEPEIESLAAIESELEGVAQKLHELRRG
ncbi:chromogranin-A isoform X1 [Lampris incognitus]|uniref:chromogranin-A isoform X1 n=2 Tax=Lampris incognitus TaxID=2546036 RepID=UPI0024B5F378|nr:chromogranin-A isoform X1 [Lampris incognitus]